MRKILIIEDDLIVGNVYRNKLSVEGFQVDIALDGLAGLEMLHNFRPDAVILDLMLPKMTGVEVLKQIRSEPDFQNLPVIVFSSTYLTNLVQEAWKAGATKCLSKANCTPKQVLEVVRSALGLNGTTATATPPRADAQAPAAKTATKAQTVPASASAPSRDSDAEFQDGLRKSFREGLPALLAQLRGLLQGLTKAANEPTQVKQLSEMYRCIRALTGNAGVAGVPQIARMSDALEALLKELHDKPKTINASSLRTVASAVDFIGLLFELGFRADNSEAGPPAVLIVDDEAISRRAVAYALEKAKLKSVCVEDPAAAYDLLAANRFDLIFLDVDMPGMNGFELCTKLRQLPAHKHTPVIFVTVLNDFESRTSSTMSGGNDFIAKPFLFMELAVKALVYVLRGRLPASKPRGK
jgi:DNA-binding response OmpR family regulator